MLQRGFDSVPLLSCAWHFCGEFNVWNFLARFPGGTHCNHKKFACFLSAQPGSAPRIIFYGDTAIERLRGVQNGG